MPAVFTACPVTGRMIATGVETDEVSLASAPAFVAKAYCPYCKTDHEWSKSSAWFDDGAGNLTRAK